MKLLFIRFMGCTVALVLSALLFQGSCPLSVLWGSALLTIFYTLLRPLLQVLISPFNLFVLGLLTPLTDALLVKWAAAWTPGLSFTYWQAVAAALTISLAYYPYSVWKKRKLASVPVKAQ